MHILAWAIIAFLVALGAAFFSRGGLPGQGPVSTTTPPAVVRRVSPPPPPPRASPPPPPPRYSQRIPEGFSVDDLSPYFEKVTVSSVSRTGRLFSSSLRYSEVRLSVNLSRGEEVNITGWKVKSNKNSFLIPQAASDYRPSGYFPRDILAKSGDRLSIFSHSAPFDINLRLNKCAGYIRGFTPEMPRACPRPDRSGIYSFTGQCQSYLLSLGTCEVPLANPPVPHSDTACLDYLGDLNYAGCYEDHHLEPGFFLSEWRVWLTKPFQPQVNIFDPLHDRVLLFDREGKLADEYIY